MTSGVVLRGEEYNGVGELSNNAETGEGVRMVRVRGAKSEDREPLRFRLQPLKDALCLLEGYKKSISWT